MEQLKDFLGFNDETFAALKRLGDVTTSRTDGSRVKADESVEEVPSTKTTRAAPSQALAEHNKNVTVGEAEQMCHLIAALLVHPQGAALRHNAISHLATRNLLRRVPQTLMSVDGGRSIVMDPAQVVQVSDFDADMGAVQTRLALAEALVLQAVTEVRVRPPRTRSGGAHEKGAAAGAADDDASSSQKHGSYPADVDYGSIPSTAELSVLADADPDLRADLHQFLQDLSLPSASILDAKQIAARVYRLLVTRDRRALLVQMRLDELLSAAAVIEGVVALAAEMDALSCRVFSHHWTKLHAESSGGSVSSEPPMEKQAETGPHTYVSRVIESILECVSNAAMCTLAGGFQSQRQLLLLDSQHSAVSGFGITPSAQGSPALEYVVFTVSVPVAALQSVHLQDVLRTRPGSVNGTLSEHVGENGKPTGPSKKTAWKRLDSREPQGARERAILAVTHNQHYLHTRRRPGELVSFPSCQIDDELPLGRTAAAALAESWHDTAPSAVLLQMGDAQSAAWSGPAAQALPDAVASLFQAVDPISVIRRLPCQRVTSIHQAADLPAGLRTIRPHDCILGVDHVASNGEKNVVWGAPVMFSAAGMQATEVILSSESPSSLRRWQALSVPSNLSDGFIEIQVARPVAVLALEAALSGRSIEELMKPAPIPEARTVPPHIASVVRLACGAASGKDITMPGAGFFTGTEEGSLNEIGTYDKFSEEYVGYAPSGYTKVDLSLRLASRKPRSLASGEGDEGIAPATSKESLESASPEAVPSTTSAPPTATVVPPPVAAHTIPAVSTGPSVTIAPVPSVSVCVPADINLPAPVPVPTPAAAPAPAPAPASAPVPVPVSIVSRAPAPIPLPVVALPLTALPLPAVSVSILPPVPSKPPPTVSVIAQAETVPVEKPHIVIPAGPDDEDVDAKGRTTSMSAPSSAVRMLSNASDNSTPLVATPARKSSVSSSTMYLAWSQHMVGHPAATGHVANDVNIVQPPAVPSLAASPMPDVTARDVVVAAMRAEHRLARLHSAAIAAAVANANNAKPGDASTEATDKAERAVDMVDELMSPRADPLPSPSNISAIGAAGTFNHPSIEALLAKRRKNRAPAQPAIAQNTKVTLKQLTSLALRRLCDVCGLPSQGDKTALITRLYAFIVADESEVQHAGSGAVITNALALDPPIPPADPVDVFAFVDIGEPLKLPVVEGELLQTIQTTATTANTNPVVILPPAACYEIALLRKYYAHQDVLAILEDLYPHYCITAADLVSSEPKEADVLMLPPPAIPPIPVVVHEPPPPTPAPTPATTPHFEVEGRSRNGRLRKPTSRIASLNASTSQSGVPKLGTVVKKAGEAGAQVAGAKRKMPYDTSNGDTKRPRLTDTGFGDGEDGMEDTDMVEYDDNNNMYQGGDLPSGRLSGRGHLTRNFLKSLGVGPAADAPKGRGKPLQLLDGSCSKLCYTPTPASAPSLSVADAQAFGSETELSPGIAKLAAVGASCVFAVDRTHESLNDVFIACGRVPDARCTLTRAVADVSLSFVSPHSFELAAGYACMYGNPSGASELTQQGSVCDPHARTLTTSITSVYENLAPLLARFPVQSLQAATAWQQRAHEARSCLLFGRQSPEFAASSPTASLAECVTYQAVSFVDPVENEPLDSPCNVVLPVLNASSADENFVLLKGNADVSSPAVPADPGVLSTVIESITYSDLAKVIGKNTLLGRYLRAARPCIVSCSQTSRGTTTYRLITALEAVNRACRDSLSGNAAGTGRCAAGEDEVLARQDLSAGLEEMSSLLKPVLPKVPKSLSSVWSALALVSELEAARRRFAAVLVECSARGQINLAGLMLRDAPFFNVSAEGNVPVTSVPDALSQYGISAQGGLAGCLFNGHLRGMNYTATHKALREIVARVCSGESTSLRPLYEFNFARTTTECMIVEELIRYVWCGHIRSPLGQVLVHPSAAVQFLSLVASVDALFRGTFDTPSWSSPMYVIG